MMAPETKMNTLKSIRPLLLLFFVITCGFILEGDEYRYPLDGYYTLSGTFGELRSNHFHSGIDIKTGGKSGLSLFASREGYVYRIKVSPFGFGKALYLRHADGRFTVYAHMSEFSTTIEDYVYREQYASKQYAQELYLSPDEIKVNRGEFIGYSGNSGSSSGPHLHFEIRDPDERIINPLAWYKNLVTDDIPPILQEVAFEPIDADSRVDGEFRKQVLTPTGSNGRYHIDQTVEIAGRVGLEYRGYDLLNGAGNHCGINRAQLFLDGKPIYEFDLERFAFDDTRNLNVHMDYKYYKDTRKRLEKAYVDHGNRLPAYKNLENWGMIELFDTRTHSFELVLSDVHGNRTTLSGNIRRKDFEPFPAGIRYSGSPSVSWEIRRNVLVVTSLNPAQDHRNGLSWLNHHDRFQLLPPTYASGNKMVFLMPLDPFNYPRMIKDEVGRFRIDLDLTDEVLPNRNNIVESGELKLFFPIGSVFHDYALPVERNSGNSRTYSDVYTVGDTDVPLFKSFLVNFQPKAGAKQTHMVVAQKNGGDWSFLGNDRAEDGSIYGAAREFGSFCLMADSIPPSISPVNFQNGGTVSAGQETLRLKLKDNFSEINSERIYCTLDDEWILFEFDAKTDQIIHHIKSRPSAGKHALSVTVFDGAGNVAKTDYSLRF
jgi:hypothetical protein